MADVSWVESVPKLPKRPKDSNKGMYGHVLVIAGGRGMAGAAGLVGGAALRSGAGLVRIACTAEIQATVASYEPSYMTYPLEADSLGFLRYQANRFALETLIDAADVVAIGPGLGRSEELTMLVRWIVGSIDKPTIVDADALNAIAGEADAFSGLTRPVILTPHPGEFGRLVGKPTAEVQADRVGNAVALAGLSEHLVVVLKGDGTIVTDGTRAFRNTTGNPGMATGGTGDVLTGIIAAMVGQKLSPFDAAVLGVYAHGLAGDIARDQNGEVGLIAGDVVDVLADAFYHLGPAD